MFTKDIPITIINHNGKAFVSVDDMINVLRVHDKLFKQYVNVPKNVRDHLQYFVKTLVTMLSQSN